VNGERPPFAGVGVPALIGTLVLASILAALIGSLLFFSIGLAVDNPPQGQGLTDSFGAILITSALISLFAAPVILAALSIFGVPMAVAFARNGLAPALRYLISGIVSVLLGAALGYAMWQGDPYGFLIGGGFALLSAWLWLSMLLWVERRRLRKQPATLI
jgi:MFS family permease